MELSIEINNKARSALNESVIGDAAAQTMAICGKQKSVLSIGFVGERVMRRLNLQRRGKDKATDILSFGGEEKELGELIICYSEIKRQAKIHKIPPESELVFVLIHGILHLAGMEDKNETERRQMIAKGLKIIKKLQLPDNFKAINNYD
jgi:probable rRNA maturation factor